MTNEKKIEYMCGIGLDIGNFADFDGARIEYMSKIDLE